ncbi:MAG: LysM peptidoglycan-binding domain-containing protein [Sphingomonas sp.]|uniref:CIS tube protein n=1 Tax=Sphingomonas sp. TaxID=28214 RepID=UPI0025FE5D9A|nr:LysM peptidoglycan-binding domain-containing protein [Sphingomonas sp.]MBQ1500535.1 LysM peptidoglycan-binding domain-containing protein [Sphingomonas sp.]
MPQELAKARIQILEGHRAGEHVDVLFNPTEYSLELSNNFQASAPPGLSNPILQFVNGNSQTLGMDLFFDTWTDGGRDDVSQLTDLLAGLVKIDAETHAPPRVEFRWGRLIFKAVIEKLSQRFTMFLSDGTPVRATVNVSFKQFKPLAEQLIDPRRNSADKTKRRVIASDDSIWLLANREYGNPRDWRLIARQNGIADPRAIRPGDVLVVPPLDEKTKGPAQ